MKIWFDMDGTIADLYAVNGWLEMLRNFDATPYEIAKPLVKMSVFARQLNAAQAKGHKIGIISWSSKVSNPAFDEQVRQAKIKWLEKHLPSVRWDEIQVVPYGQNKWETCKGGTLFDDEEQNRNSWKNACAFEPQYIHEVLHAINYVGR